MADATRNLLYGVRDIHEPSGDIAAGRLADLLEVSRAQLARMLGVSRQLLAQSPGSPRVQRELRRLEYLFARLRNLTGSEADARVWLKMGHPDFDGVAPIDLLEAGQLAAVEDLVGAIEVGLPR